MEERKIIKAGLIKGRHLMPVKDYIFNEDIHDVFDYIGIRKHIEEWLKKKFTFEETLDSFQNKADYLDIGVKKTEEILEVYITGLTPVVIELINACYLNGVRLRIMNYNRDTNTYVSQKIYALL